MSGITITNNENLADHITDVLNNEIGISIGTAEENQGATNKEMAQQVLNVFRKDGLWVENETENGTFEFTRQKLTRRQYNQMSSRLDELDENGRTTE